MKNGTLRTVEGNVTEPQTTTPKEVVLIVHCCNNGGESGIGVMGAGVALALRKKWMGVYTSYKTMEAESKKGLRNRLGEICFERVEDNIIVVNMIGQDGIVSADNSKPVKYWALQKCMEQVRINLIAIISAFDEEKKKYVIHCPKFGSGLAMGDWNFILELIREQWLEQGIDVVIYNYVE